MQWLAPLPSNQVRGWILVQREDGLFVSFNPCPLILSSGESLRVEVETEQCESLWSEEIWPWGDQQCGQYLLLVRSE